MDAYTFSKALTRRLDRVARQTGARTDTLVRDAVKRHLDYLEWLDETLDEAEQEAEEKGWLTTDEVQRAMNSEATGRARGRVRSR